MRNSSVWLTQIQSLRVGKGGCASGTRTGRRSESLVPNQPTRCSAWVGESPTAREWAMTAATARFVRKAGGQASGGATSLPPPVSFPSEDLRAGKVVFGGRKQAPRSQAPAPYRRVTGGGISRYPTVAILASTFSAGRLPVNVFAAGSPVVRQHVIARVARARVRCAAGGDLGGASGAR
jgi:hypothetical protein